MRPASRAYVGPLFACLVLAGCGTLQAYRARTALLGATEPDIVSCMGVPAEKQYLGRDQAVLQWDYAQTGTDLDFEFGLYSLRLGRPGLCHAAIRFDHGLVRAVHFTGAAITPTDPDSICGRLVHDCLYHRERTALPADFESLAVLDGRPSPHEVAVSPPSER